MSIIGFVVGLVVLVAAVVAYQVYKAKKAVTVANVVAQAKSDEAVVKSSYKP